MIVPGERKNVFTSKEHMFSNSYNESDLFVVIFLVGFRLSNR
jgi:hypothetical protein